MADSLCGDSDDEEEDDDDAAAPDIFRIFVVFTRL